MTKGMKAEAPSVSEAFAPGYPEEIGSMPRETQGTASLAPFPPRLQDVIIGAVLEARPERATDIWHEDKQTDTIFVMRYRFQWHFNKTASLLWKRLGPTLKEILEELQKEYPESDPKEIRFLTVEFLLHAASYGLVQLYPDVLEESK